MAIDIFGERMKDGVGSELERRLVVRREKCVIDKHEWARRMPGGDTSNVSNINESKSRVRGSFYPNKLIAQGPVSECRSINRDSQVHTLVFGLREAYIDSSSAFSRSRKVTSTP